MTCHPYAQRAASAVVSSLEFLALHDTSTRIGRARLLDGSVGRGPFSFWRRVPTTATPDRDPASTVYSSDPLFAFSHSSDFTTALAIDLLAFPPLAPCSDSPAFCSACHPSVDDASIATLGPRHFTQCQHGVRLESSIHRPVVAALAAVFSAALGPDRVIADLGRRDGPVVDFMQTAGAGLHHTPDLVLIGLDGPGTYRIVEVKTLDPCAPTHLGAHHTDSARLAAHTAAIQTSRRQEYRVDGPGASALPPRMRLSFLAISIFGSISSSGHHLIRDVCLAAGRSVPSPLLHAASWAAPEFAPFIRMALVLAIRRGLASAVRAHRSSEPDLDSPAPAEPPPTPATPPRAPPAPAPGPPPAALAAALFGGPA